MMTAKEVLACACWTLLVPIVAFIYWGIATTGPVGGLMVMFGVFFLAVDAGGILVLAEAD